MTAPTDAPWLLRCPVCSTPVPDRAHPGTACAGCGLPAAGHAGVVVGRIGATLAELHRDRDALLATLRAHATSPAAAPAPSPAPVPTQAPAPRPAVRRPPPPRPPAGGPGGAPPAGPTVTPAAPAPRRRVSPQQVLVGLGSLLVVAAAMALVAVGWTRLGLGFQATVMATATATAAVTSAWAARRGLRATEEGLAATAAALLLVDVTAARALGLAGLDEVPLHTYTAGALAVVTLLAAGLRAATRSTLVWPAVALLAAQPVLPLALGGHADGVAGVVALLALAAADAAVAGRLPRWSADVARLLSAVAAGCGSLLAVGLAWSAPLAEGAAATAVLTAAAAAVVLLVLRRARRGGPVPVPAPVACLAAVPALALAGLAQAAGAVAAPLLALVGLALATVCVLVWPEPLARELAGGPAAALVVVGTVQLDVADRPAALALVALAATVPAALTALVRQPARVPAVVAALLLPGGAVLAAREGAVLAAPVAGLLLALLGAAALGLAAVRLGRPEERAAALTAPVLAAAAAVTGASVGAWGQVGAQLALVGAAGLAYAVAGRRVVTGWVALADLVVATWIALAGAAVVTVEAYSLPLAAALLLAAGPQLRREPSWRGWGPALVVGFAPSVVAALGTGDPARTGLVVVAGVVAVVAGTLTHRQAPFVVGAVSAGLVAAVETAPWVARLESWVPLGTAGLLLLVLGASYERRRQQAREAVAWVSDLR
ncbi:SCO7613 C-terminal domain-containing membrane protein [Klenkia brasiliensis]|uniref:Uncharacterized protein n=1 Tax=Klenkia brasiliensis TaxID=333142 RepID=A0A1G7T1Y4_9ACTN|nr:hypothetical protein [Klenkia brasiliensis]SDG28600.1 hypothetical protein SAMN05660324_2242 [Klenkia brasiliensis]